MKPKVKLGTLAVLKAHYERHLKRPSAAPVARPCIKGRGKVKAVKKAAETTEP